MTGEAEGRNTVVERVGSKLKFLPCHGVVWPRASVNLCARPIWNSAAVTAVRAKVLFCVYNTEHGAGKGLSHSHSGCRLDVTDTGEDVGARRARPLR